MGSECWLQRVGQCDRLRRPGRPISASLELDRRAGVLVVVEAHAFAQGQRVFSIQIVDAAVRGIADQTTVVQQHFPLTGMRLMWQS